MHLTALMLDAAASFTSPLILPSPVYLFYYSSLHAVRYERITPFTYAACCFATLLHNAAAVAVIVVVVVAGVPTPRNIQSDS